MELTEQLKYLREENMKLRAELDRKEKLYLEVIDKWNEAVDRLHAVKCGDK